MSDNYPRLLYKKGGTNPEPVHGHILGIKTVHNATEEDDAQEDGWLRTTDEAVATYLDSLEPEEQTSVSKAKRDELEEEAQSLGIKFDGRTSDYKLIDKIAQAKEVAA